MGFGRGAQTESLNTVQTCKLHPIPTHIQPSGDGAVYPVPFWGLPCAYGSWFRHAVTPGPCMAPSYCPSLEQSSTCFILSLPVQPRLSSSLHPIVVSPPLPCSLRYGGPVHTVRFPPRLLFSEGSQTKLSWRTWGSKPAGHVTGHLETGACMVFAGAHTFEVRELSVFKAGTIIQDSEIEPKSFRLEGDRPYGLALLWV